ncbi:DUF1515 domain-containing protein, partial [Rhizobium leguminosarum]|uniref:DUF1515 family protein n=1 Tax=Rhizobium ruizarguesonis TaxID=2081791 RepID=UPI0013B74F98
REAGLAVTGTPVENRLLDLWSIVDFVLPGHLGDAKDFGSEYADDVDGAAKLEPLVSPLMLRRRVAEVAQDLPRRIDIPQVVELDEGEIAAYDTERERIYAEYGAAATLVALTSLRRFCAHPDLMSGNAATADPMSFTKFRRMDEIVDRVSKVETATVTFKEDIDEMKPTVDDVKIWRQRGIGALAIVGVGASAITFIVTKFGTAVLAWATSR